MATADAFKGASSVLAYINDDLGRKLGKTKMYEDIDRGLLRKQADGTFKRRDVDRYAASLDLVGVSDAVAKGAAERQRKKEELTIEDQRIKNELSAHKLAVLKGQYVKRESVHMELAARAIALSSGLKTAFEAHALDIIAAVGGDPRKATQLLDAAHARIDDALHEYSKEISFEVEFASDGAGMEEDAHASEEQDI